MKLVLASGNQGKLKEIKAIMAPLGIELSSAAELGFEREIEETGKSFADNAELKARTVARALGLPALADDSGLSVNALGGKPGVFSARYSGPGATDQSNNSKLLEELKDVPSDSRSAAFVCVMACCKPSGELLLAKGTLNGWITVEPKGKGGFGYDPVFRPKGRKRTVAQLEPGEKNAVSHRGKALANLMERLPGFLAGVDAQ